MKNFGFIAFFFITACASLPKSTVLYSSYNNIRSGAGPEDILVDSITGNPRLLISCDERREGIEQGSIWMYDFESKQSKAFKIVFPSSGYYFHPHGMSILLKGEEAYLFVINHKSKNEEEVIRFKIYTDSLVYDKIFDEGLIGNPNDIYAIDLDEFYYTDYKKIGGSLVHVSGNTFTKVVKHLSLPNGVHVLREKSNSISVYVSTTLGNNIYRCVKGKDCELEKTKIAKIKGGDNFEFYNDSLLITSHSRFIKFMKHEKNSEKYSPSIVYLMHPKTGKKRVVFSDDGSEISAVSTGVIYNGKLYLGQVFEPFVLECTP